jgi:hypothetical protein
VRIPPDTDEVGADGYIASSTDPPRESIPTGCRDFGLVWSVGAGISSVFRTQHTQLTTSSKSLFSATAAVLSVSSFSEPPFTSESGSKSCRSFGSAASSKFD